MSAGDRTESDYYAFRDFDEQNARTVLSFYTQFFGSGPVLELACGPGVFLDLLAEAGIDVHGVDLDPGMVELARKGGHRVVLDDALAYLRATPDASQQGLFAAHFVEHLTADVAQELYTQAARVLRPGGVFVAATPNAACMSVLGHDFWRDPTHVRFYDPLALEFFAREAGLVVAESGANPQNHPGPPPNLRPISVDVFADLSENVSELLGGLRRRQAERNEKYTQQQQQQEASRLASLHRRPIPTPAEVDTESVEGLLHLIAVLDDRFQKLQHVLHSQQQSYQNLLDELYPPNEIYVVARRSAEQVSRDSPEE